MLYKIHPFISGYPPISLCHYMSSTCTFGLEMATSEIRQRRNLNAGTSDGGSEGKRNEEPSLLRGMLPCVIGVAGVSLFLWALVYFLIPPEVFSGKSLCTRVREPVSLAGDLSSIADWQRFAQELGVPKEEIQLGENQIEQILRIWEKRAGLPCLEKLVKTLNKMNKEELAKKVTAKLQTTASSDS